MGIIRAWHTRYRVDIGTVANRRLDRCQQLARTFSFFAAAPVTNHSLNATKYGEITPMPFLNQYD